MTLTDRAVRAARPRDKAYKIADRDGLHLLVATNGSRLWRMNYRFAGKQKTLSYGPYPQVTLSEVRTKHQDARKLLSKGTDPAVQAMLEKLTRTVSNNNTFGLIADEHLAKLKREGKAESTLKKTAWLIDLARPFLAERPISEIGAMEVLLVLRKVEARGRLETARRLRSTIGTIFRYAIATARAETDPTIALKGAISTPKVKSRAAVIDPKKLGLLLRVIDGLEAYPSTVAALRLLPLLFSRPGELRQAEWSEFDLDLSVWTIPEDRMKMRRPHRVPLSKQAVVILDKLKPITGDGQFTFPSVRSLKRPISDGTLNAALMRLGYSADEVTPHGFRATASTLLNESGKWNPDAIERQLAHIEGNEVRRAYARGENWEERIRMMQWWADYLDELKAGV